MIILDFDSQSFSIFLTKSLSYEMLILTKSPGCVRQNLNLQYVSVYQIFIHG